MSPKIEDQAAIVRRGKGFSQFGWAFVALLVAFGWISREVAFSKEKVEELESTTINLADLKLNDYAYDGKVVGKVGIYLAGNTAKSTQFVTGRLVLNPGETPHPPHTHVEEEIMVIEQGTGEISVDGKITKIAPGTVMYTEPNVAHGIVNTGKEPIVFTFVKWAAKGK